tara:strand:- start:129 stop:713 length:585 start_codon:yes stop_codon:yes gene_type:complete
MGLPTIVHDLTSIEAGESNFLVIVSSQPSASLKVQVGRIIVWACSQMTVNTPEEGDSPDLRERLGNIPRARLVDEVVSRWDDIIRLEGELISMRRRTREAEMLAISGRGEGSHVAELEERLRVAASKIRQLETAVENERSRREGAEAESTRFSELQHENSRLLRNEEELLLLILDMESQIEKLTPLGPNDQSDD